jgi:hypothetical protein
MKSLPIGLKYIAQVIQSNCHISDAQYAEHFSLCIYLLRMREYYRWENDIPLTQALDKKAVGDWLSAREQSWELYQNKPLQLIPTHAEANAFDTDTINRYLIPIHYVYTAGYGLFKKPQFCLADLLETRTIQGTLVYILGKEYARDLIAPPAMFINNTIYIRREPLRRFIWEKIEEWQWKKDSTSPIALLLQMYGQPLKMQDVESTIDHICETEIENLILHEMGEQQAGDMLGPKWKKLLNSVPRSATEIRLRGIKDHLADCLVTLPTLIQDNNKASLHFYFANFTGMRKELFPEAYAAYQHWNNSGNLDNLKSVVEQGKIRWYKTAQTIINAYATEQHSIDTVIDAVNM